MDSFGGKAKHGNFMKATGGAISGAAGGALVGSFFGPTAAMIGALTGGLICAISLSGYLRHEPVDNKN